MKILIQIILWLMVVALVGISIVSSLDANVLVGVDEILETSWGLATLMDLYFGFILMSFIAFYSESHKGLKIFWPVLIMSLGNFGSAIFLLRVLLKAPIDKALKLGVAQ